MGTPAKSSWATLLDKASVGLFIVGFVARVAPLFDQGGRMLRQYPTEDGYLMLTIARNLALGRGMSTAAGELPTNGTQPLFNVIEAGVFWLNSGARESSVRIILILQVLIAMLAAWAIRSLTLAVLSKDRPERSSTANLAASAWFASSVIVPHSMNCLETGLYLALCAASTLAWHRLQVTDPERPRWWRVIGTGVMLGLTFLARIDAVFLIASLTAWHVLLGRKRSGPNPLGRSLAEALVMGTVSVIVGSPWLLNNLLSFGALMPISGTAQSFRAVLGNNLGEVPIKLFEYASVLVPIPEVWEKRDAAVVLTTLVLVAYSSALPRIWKSADAGERALFAPAVTHAAMMLVYYGLFFGARHFLGRYLSPLSIWTCILASSLACASLNRLGGARVLYAGVLSAGVLGLGLLNVRAYGLGTKHQHFHVVEWVRSHVSERTWVGAIQTGTLGFFHDRTVNLDGKVNPEALRAKLARKIPEYVVLERFGPEQQHIEVLADWGGIASWMQHEPLRCAFDVTVFDKARNLAVLSRRSTPAANCPP